MVSSLHLCVYGQHLDALPHLGKPYVGKRAIDRKPHDFVHGGQGRGNLERFVNDSSYFGIKGCFSPGVARVVQRKLVGHGQAVGCDLSLWRGDAFGGFSGDVREEFEGFFIFTSDIVSSR